MISRRRFLGYGVGALATASCAAVPRQPGRRHGSRPRIAVAGVRAQGRRHLEAWLRRGDVDIAAVCDPDTILAVQAARFCARFGRQVEVHRDVRRLLENPAVDGLVVATPDHWHALLAGWALQAGKFVHLEAPVTHAIDEGQWLTAMEAASRACVVPCLDARQQPAVRDAAQFVREGGMGRVRGVRVLAYHRRHAIGRVRDHGFVPEHVDFDLWTGPAPLRPLARRRLHGDWRFDWDTGNGDLADAALEHLDVARLLLGAGPFPEAIWSVGGRFGDPDDGETPNTLLCRMDFDGVPLVLELRNLPRRLGAGSEMDRVRGLQQGVFVEGDGRTLVLDGAAPAAVVVDGDGNLLQRFRGRVDTRDAFVAALLTGERPEVGLDEGRRAADLLHLVNLVHRSGHPARRVEALRSVVDDPVLLAGFDALDLHLSRNGLSLDHQPVSFRGRTPVDPETGRLPALPESAGLRRRNYRRPFEPYPEGVHGKGSPHP